MSFQNNIIVFSQSFKQEELSKIYKIKILPILHPLDNSMYKYLNFDKLYDIGMTGALHNIKHYSKDAFLEGEKNIRERIVNLLKNTSYKKYIKCSDKSYSGGKIVDTNEYVKIINQARIWITTNADHGDCTARVCEIIGCKTLLFYNEQSCESLGEYFKDGETCVFFKNDLGDLIEKIDYYLAHPELCKKITDNAWCIFNEHFSTENIIKKLLIHAN